MAQAQVSSSLAARSFAAGLALAAAFLSTSVGAQAPPPVESIPAVPPGYEALVPPPPPSGAASEIPPPPFGSAGPHTVADRTPPSPLMRRVLPETLGWGAGWLVGGLALVGLAVAGSAFDECGLFSEFCSGPGTGFVVGAVLGFGAFLAIVPAGIHLAGETAGGSGSYGMTLLGHLIGVLGGSLLAGLVLDTVEDSDVGSGITTTLILASSLAGGLIGYELSQKDEVAAGTSVGTTLELHPTVGPTAHGGAIVGILASF